MMTGKPDTHLLELVLRMGGAILCYSRAKILRRHKWGWAVFGFTMPIIPVIWIFCLKPIMKWEEVEDRDENTDL